ncbi:POK9 protein, partial [Probosciger aterrimus]|nr:POK9 protein [Probosciger aterrimus]
SGSAGEDVATAIDYTIVDTKVHCIPSVLNGPLGAGLCALILGRSSTSLKGVFVLPGVIDAGFTGNIGIMVQTCAPPINIPKGSKIAQLVPFESKVPRAGKEVRGKHAWGSTGQPKILFTIDILKHKPETQVTLKGPGNQVVTLSMLIDTGADVSII